MSEVTVLNSIGGCASSQLFKIINGLGIESNRDHFHQGINFGRCKHTLYPPQYKEIDKAIFVMGDPVQSVISLFRRDMGITHIENKGLPLHPTRTDNVEIHPTTKEIYRTHPEFKKHYNLKEYVEGKEIFVDFLGCDGVPDSYVKKPRNSSMDLVPDEMREEFTEILSKATELYEELPDFLIK